MLSIGLGLNVYSVNPIIQAYRVQVTELNLPSILFLGFSPPGVLPLVVGSVPSFLKPIKKI